MKRHAFIFLNLYLVVVRDHEYGKNVCMVDQGTETTVTLESMASYSDENFLTEGNMKRKFVMEDVLKTDSSCKFYTGMNKVYEYKKND